MTEWLSYANSFKDKSNEGKPNNYFHRREIAFTLPGDIYCRYLCFRNAKEFRTHCVKERPIKMDIGAIFNAPVNNHKFNHLNFLAKY